MQSSEALLRTYLVWDEALVAHGDGGLRGLDALGELGVDAEVRAHGHGPRRSLRMTEYHIRNRAFLESLLKKNLNTSLSYCPTIFWKNDIARIKDMVEFPFSSRGNVFC